jgi:hypothetical protein
MASFFNVPFKNWSDFSNDTSSKGGIAVQLVKITDVQAKIELCELLVRMHSAGLKRPGEEREMALLEIIINAVLELSGFEFAKISNNLHDFEFWNETDVVLYSEVKECGMLPRVHINDAHELCLYGFAEKIATSSTQTTSTMTAEYQGLNVDWLQR